MSKFLSTLAVAGLLASTTAVFADTATEGTTADAAATETMAIVVDADLAKKGKKVFKKCKACHKVGDKAKNAVGPVLNGVYGRTPGTFEGFKYSKNMKALGETLAAWDEEHLNTFLTKPKNMVKKTKMSFAGLKKEKDRKAVIEYLKSLSVSK